LAGEDTRFLPGEESCKEATRRTGLNTKPNNLRLELERRQESFWAKEKTAGQPKNKLVCFSGLPGGFSLCARAQQGQLRWPARKRGDTLLLQFVFAAFMATNGVFCFSFDAKEKRSPLYPQLLSVETL